MKLMEYTVLRLRTTQQSVSELAKAIDVTPAWIRLLAAGDIKDPSVNKIEALYEHLTGTKLLQE